MADGHSKKIDDHIKAREQYVGADFKEYGKILGGVWLQLCFVGLFWLFLLNKGLVSRLLNNKFSVILGSYSYAIFLGHTIVIRAIKDYIDLQKISFVFEHNFIFVALLCLLIFIFAVIVHHLVEMPLIKIVSKILR
jgi:peptidoglycan/LPS O-acetylase OafA/YrhL